MSAPHDFQSSRPVRTKEARQGETGHNVRYVLAAGTLGAAIVLALLFIYYFGLHA